MNKPIVVCGFSGIGKTELARRSEAYHIRTKVLDLDSSSFRYIHDVNGHKFNNLDFPENYIEAIKKYIETKEYDYILVSMHSSLRAALHDAGISYVAVIPRAEDCEQEYLRRYFRRGDSPEHIYETHFYWNAWLKDIEKTCEEHNMPCIKLGPTWYLSDIFE